MTRLDLDGRAEQRRRDPSFPFVLRHLRVLNVLKLLQWERYWLFLFGGCLSVSVRSWTLVVQRDNNYFVGLIKNMITMNTALRSLARRPLPVTPRSKFCVDVGPLGHREGTIGPTIALLVIIMLVVQ